jgi:hypothetical protein
MIWWLFILQNREKAHDWQTIWIWILIGFPLPFDFLQAIEDMKNNFFIPAEEKISKVQIKAPVAWPCDEKRVVQI